MSSNQMFSWIYYFERFTGRHSDLLSVTECLCHKWPWMSFVCRNHNPTLSSFKTYHRVCNKSNAMGTTCGSRTAYPPGAPDFLCEVRVARFWVFCLVFCTSLFVRLFFFYWPLYCLSFFDLRLLITNFVSSNFLTKIIQGSNNEA